MHKLISKLMIYRNISKDSILYRIADIMKYYENGACKKETAASLLLDETYNIIELATKYRFDSDLWISYITYLLATSENPFTLEAERNVNVNDTLKKLALNDLAIFKELMDFDFKKIENDLDVNCFSILRNYKNNIKDELSYNHNSSIVLKELYNNIIKTKDENDLYYNIILSFYQKYGVGNFGINKAFRVSSENEKDILVPIMGTSNMNLSDLIGYEDQKQQLIKNTEAFVNGELANNVLLYGDAGTGKSSSIKALLNMYYEKGLRMIEIYKYDFKYLPQIISVLKNRNYKFIIYMDDLSFEKNETEYKYLKAVIEGGLEVKPENVLIYATSNRVHLLHESFSDRQEVEKDDVHIYDTLTEQTSLANRFGLTIGYFSVRRQEFFDMICTMAKENEKLASMDKEEIIKKATVWNMYHGDLSGRAAKQFISYLSSNIE